MSLVGFDIAAADDAQPAVTAAAPATADSGSSASQAARLPEIVVTARRVEENIQDVPSAVTAIGAAQVAALRVQSAADLNGLAPNLEIRHSSAANYAIQLRGIDAGGLTNQTLDEPVAIYLDGVYLGRGTQAIFNTQDIASIEVLRGPQGTLFGRNAVAGAVSFTSQSPSGHFDGSVEGTYGNYNEQRLKVTLDAPEVDGFSARVTYTHDWHDGWVKDTLAGTTTTFENVNALTNIGATANVPSSMRSIVAQPTLGMQHMDSATLAIKYTGIDKLTIEAKLDASDLHYTQAPLQILGFSTLAQGIAPTYYPIDLALSTISNKPYFMTSMASAMNGLSHQQDIGTSVTATYEVTPSISFKNIFGYRALNQVNIIDADDSDYWINTGGILHNAAPEPFDYLASIQGHWENQWSDEFQVLGKAGRIDWILGAFYFVEHSFDQPLNPDLTAFPSEANRVIVANAAQYGASSYYGSSRGESNAVYGHITDHLTDQLDLAAGLRYTQDRKAETLLGDCRFPNAAAGDRIAPLYNVPIGTGIVYCYTAASSTVGGITYTRPNSASLMSSNTDWDVSLTYAIVPDVKVYVRGATGYESAGFLNFYTYLPEKDTSGEFGIKSEFLDHTLLFDADAFYTHRQNAQQPAYYGSSVGSHIDNITFNDEGFEAETKYVPIAGLTFSNTLGYTFSKSQANIVRQDSPRWNTTFTGQYDTAKFSNGMYLSFRTDAEWVDSFPTAYVVPTVAGTTSVFGNTNDQAAKIPAQWTWNGSVALLAIPVGSTQAHVSLWVKNLLNEHNLSEAFNDVVFVVDSYEEPRTFGIDVGVKF